MSYTGGGSGGRSESHSNLDVYESSMKTTNSSQSTSLASLLPSSLYHQSNLSTSMTEKRIIPSKLASQRRSVACEKGSSLSSSNQCNTNKTRSNQMQANHTKHQECRNIAGKSAKTIASSTRNTIKLGSSCDLSQTMMMNGSASTPTQTKSILRHPASAELGESNKSVTFGNASNHLDSDFVRLWKHYESGGQHSDSESSDITISSGDTDNSTTTTKFRDDNNTFHVHSWTHAPSKRAHKSVCFIDEVVEHNFVVSDDNNTGELP